MTTATTLSPTLVTVTRLGDKGIDSKISSDHGDTWNYYSGSVSKITGDLYGLAPGGSDNRYLVMVGTLQGGVTGFSARSRDGQLWETGTTISHGFASVTGSGNEKLIATVSNSPTTIYSSTDGLTWTSQTVSSAGNYWVSVASDWGTGNITMINYLSTKSAHSVDNGVTWTYSAALPERSFSSWALQRLRPSSLGMELVYAGGFIRETSANVWTSFAGPASYACISMAANGNTRVLCGASATNGETNKVYYSTTSGSSWTQATVPEPEIWTHVEFDGTKYVLFGRAYGSVFTSTDGITWIKATTFITPPTITTVFYPVSIGYPNSNLFVETSSITKKIDAAKQSIISSTSLATGVRNTLTRFRSIVTQSLEPTVSQGSLGFGMVSTLLSNRAMTFERTSASFHKMVSLIANRTFVKRVIQSSSPTLTSISNKFWSAPWSMLYAFSKWIGVKANSRKAATSTDGSSWTPRALTKNLGWNTIATNGTIIASLATNSDVANTSADGITWTERSLPVSRCWQSLVANSSRFVAVALQTDKGLTSTDGITWTEITLPKVANWTSVAWNGTVFCAITDSSVAATSTDGITWVERTMPDNIHYNCVTWYLNRFTAVASGPTDKAATSADGITWSRITMPAIADWTSVGPGVGDPDA